MLKQSQVIPAVAVCCLVAVACFAADPVAEWADGAFRVEAPRANKGWVAEAAPKDWKPVAQPDLAQALEAVPKLALEDVAPPPNRCWVGQRPYVVPNPDGKSWDMLFPYYNKYRGKQEVVIHDFGTGETMRQLLSKRDGKDVLTQEAIGFHMKPSYYTEGKLVFPMYGAVLFIVYDPAENKFVHGSKPFGDNVTHGRAVLGEDGRVYGMGWPKDKSGFVAYCFDPKTYETKRWPTFGPPNQNRRELYGQVTMFGDWLYADIGSEPWHLVAVNVKTGEGRLLASSENILGSGSTIRLGHMQGGLSGTIQHAAAIDGIKDFDRKLFNFWLYEGRIVKREGDVPPWSDQPVKSAERRRRIPAREFQVWPAGFEPAVPPPDFKNNSGAPDADGLCALQYRMPGEKEWRTMEYTVEMYPGEVNLLTEVNDHTLFAVDSGYGQHVFYDLRTKKAMRVGGTLSPYSMTVFRDRLYVSGYPSSQIFIYDFTRPLGLKQAQPNPWRGGYIGKKDQTHCPLGGTVGCADGRVYNAGTTYGRRREGGGFGWYDTETKELGGMPIDGHRFFWSTSAVEGRYLLMASKFGEEGMLFCWDTRARDFLYKKKILGASTPGPIEEVLPGLVMGHTKLGADKGAVLYGLQPETGEILWTKPVPAGPVTAYGSIREHGYTFRRGPKGMVWASFHSVIEKDGKEVSDDTLVKIDPRDVRVTPVGKTSPLQLGFAGGQVYVAGGEMVRRIKDLRTDNE